MKGILLCGGKGTRLLPATKVVNKHMIPVLNQPMIVYPLETLKSFGITEIMVVTGGNHIGGIGEFLGSGRAFGVKLTYRVQEEAGGIAQALALAEDFVGKDSCMVVLGDNVFSETGFRKDVLKELKKDRALFFFKHQIDNARFGVPVFKVKPKTKPWEMVIQKLLRIEEKPQKPLSEFAVTGLYVYPSNVFKVIKTLKPSKRGELEISDVNNWYIKHNKCDFSFFESFWSDAGTVDSLKEVVDWAYQESLTNGK